MRRKVIIGLGIFVVLLAAAFAYLNYRNRTLSPPGSSELSHLGVDIRVDYSRPSVREREIFGSSSEALQPYGEYWRLGANESTKINFNKDILFNGVKVPAGTYKVYAFPGKDSFDLRLNTEYDVWGYSPSDDQMDVLKTDIPVLKNGHTEQFTMNLRPAGDGMVLEVMWADVKLQIPIEPVR